MFSRRGSQGSAYGKGGGLDQGALRRIVGTGSELIFPPHLSAYLRRSCNSLKADRLPARADVPHLWPPSMQVEGWRVPPGHCLGITVTPPCPTIPAPQHTWDRSHVATTWAYLLLFLICTDACEKSIHEHNVPQTKSFPFKPRKMWDLFMLPLSCSPVSEAPPVLALE